VQSPPATAAPVTERSASTLDRVVVEPADGVCLRFAVYRGFLLGLHTASVHGVELKSDATVQRPVLAEEYGDGRMVWPITRFDRVERDGDTTTLHGRPVGFLGEAALRREFVFAEPAGDDATAADLLRDHYAFPVLRLPSETCGVDALIAWIDGHGGDGHEGGTSAWVIEPAERTIAGWPWAGWRQHHRFTLPGDRKVTAVRQVGTWEIDGRAAGLTVVNMRYRGLGRIEQTLSSAEDDSGATADTWSTTEMMPGAAGEGPVVSPAVPEGGQDLSDRGYAMRHRVSAWIVRLARGAGVSVFDFQHRPHAVFASLFERQGNLRAVTEVFPGDAAVSQTDEELFPLSGELTTQPQTYLALVDRGAPFSIEQRRTRWKEIDQHVRDTVSDALDMEQPEVVPTVGFLLERELGENLADIGKRSAALAGQGVRAVMIHNPGWMNHTFRGPDGPENRGGSGICSIYDWRPTSDAAGPWRKMVDRMHAHGLRYFTWLTGMVWGDSPFVDAVGRELHHWGINAPGETTSRGYSGHLDHNIHDDRCRTLLLERLTETQERCGFDGFWADSFQNLYMSVLDWAGGEAGRPVAAPMQRAWWEQIAAWSREGVAWMAESQSAPGLSCSIEVSDWDRDFWYFPHVCRWFRTGQQDPYEPEARARLLFRVMANGGWLAPDLYPLHQAHWLDQRHRRAWKLPGDVIPGFTQLARGFTAAQPMMQRPYVLPDGRGVLWLPADQDTAGALFPFENIPLPTGVSATDINTDDTAAAALSSDTVYRVEGDGLLAAFGIRRPPLDDRR